ncbi:sigma-70 family RNA polymerase sigma factor [Dactylosporangium sp. AC04546]|uniref:sigma-70 family RNA polymerase sigma factor n=1 Tax=Dactylosporangium sp. AC04546 TaxID=2862460 RepID=UPI002E7BF47C|nr:sigma-70 family RNA polymerase sigma factor [Dactylosporangium sp. AC04546]WVK79432.1 sigma-70 family RNA polymerase sigma factor [Dactylosporangium sp. AC04546]
MLFAWWGELVPGSVMHMGRTGTRKTTLVAAAQAGDARAIDELMAAFLPLVYTIVRRALAGHPAAVDDVVQDTMVRALRQLPSLREPDSFRAWIAAIAVRQAATYLQSERLAAARTAALDNVAGAPDAVDFEDLTLLRLELAGQRRQVGQAVAWLDPDDRVLWSLWWLEVGEELSRAELAAALGVSVPHAGVRVQRMRNRLDQARALAAALEARPRCPWLDTVVADWDGIPSPLWRKRIARHIRACATCAAAAEEMVDTERLLAGFALLPVPAILTAALAGHGPSAASSATAGGLAATTGYAPLTGSAGTAGGAAAAAGHGPLAASAVTAAGGTAATTGWLAGFPVAKAAIAATIVAGTAVAALTWPSGEGAPPTPAAPSSRPSPSASSGQPALRLGQVSFESGAVPGRYLGTDGQFGVLVAASSSTQRGRATFEAVPGLSNAGCYSFRAANGQYLRHLMWRLRLSADEGSFVFRGDATFCATVTDGGEVFLESANYPGHFIHRQHDQLWVDQADGSAGFRADSVFRLRPPLA